jgi:hypothetical protein
MKNFLFLIVILITCQTFGQKSTLSGIITDQKTGETLVGATMLLKGDVNRGTTTDINGFFSLPGIDPGKIKVEFSFIGYETESCEYNLANKNKLFVEIKLIPKEVLLGQATVVESGTDKLGDREIEISQHSLTPKTIQSIPTARNDVFKALRYLPGIEQTEPLSPLVSVRGSDPGENLIMLDGVTIYNPYHFLSSSGIFNMQTVKNVDMMVGGFGAEYGGRNSSVINISTKDGNNSNLHGEIQPTTAESKIFLEFPVGEKSTMMIAGRFNYDLIGNFLLYSNNYFYDMNLSFTHHFNSKNSLTLKYFGSGDHTNLDFNSLYRYMGNSIGNSFGINMEDIFNDMSLKWINHWNNHIVTAILKSALTPNLFLRAQVYGSMHKADNYSEMVMDFDDMVFNTSTRFKSKVNDWCAKFSLDYKPFYWNNFKIGGEYNSYLFENGSEINKVDNGSSRHTPQLISLFAEDKITIGPLQIRPGIRATSFENHEVLYEPRVNAVVNLGNNFKFQAAWGRYYQYIISMNTQEFEYNQFLDYYYPLGNHEPSLSYHYIVGLEKSVNSQHTFSVDLYYKDIARTYIFDLLQNQFEVFALSDKIIAGKGRSYGMELMWKGSFYKFSGWASYTLSKSTRSFPNIMNGKQYDYDYDRRHSIKAVMNYQATKRISYSAAFIAQSGVPRSVENSFQMFYMYDPLTGTMVYSPQNITNQKNGVRMPWLLYLDFGLQKKVVSGFGNDLARFFGATESYLTVNVYNALFFRRNVLYYIPVGVIGKMIPMGDNYFPMVAAGYTLKF